MKTSFAVESGLKSQQLLKDGLVNEAFIVAESYWDVLTEDGVGPEECDTYELWQKKYIDPTFYSLCVLAGISDDERDDLTEGLFMSKQSDWPDFNSLLKVS